MSEAELAQIPNVPKGGPLEEYRKQASFDWKKIKLFFEDFELTQYKVIRILMILNFFEYYYMT